MLASTAMSDAHDPRATARAHLADLLARIMEDGQVDEREKKELIDFLNQGLLSVPEVREVFSTYLKGLQDDVLADGLVTEDEQTRIQNAVKQLRIPHTFLSPELKAIVEGRGVPKK